MADTEEPKYEIVERYDGWEVRRYAPMIQSHVTVEGAFRDALSAGFRALAGYIFGQNSGSGTNSDSEKIAMTAPVSATLLATDMPNSKAPPRWRVSFTMPASYTMRTLPRPTNKQVTLEQHAGGLHAVVRFSGKLKSHTDSQSHQEKLLRSLSGAGLRQRGSAVIAQYNGPWVPGPFRRNEVLFPVECVDENDARCTESAR